MHGSSKQTVPTRTRKAVAWTNKLKEMTHLDARTPDTAHVSHMQEQFWILQRMDPLSPAYNLVLSIDIPEMLDREALQKCLYQVAIRHESLRTTFSMINDRLFQIIHPEPICTIEYHDLSNCTETEGHDTLRKIMDTESKRVFDLSKLPLLKPILFQFHPGRWRLDIVFHHIIVDAFSMHRILVPELNTLYKSAKSETSTPLAPPRMQFRDIAELQRRQSLDLGMDRDIQYWKKKLHDFPPESTLPSDRARTPSSNHIGALHTVILKADLIQDLRALSQTENVSLYSILLAAFFIQISQYSERPDIIIGTVFSNRDNDAKKEVVGPLINTIALRGLVDEDMCFSTFIHQIAQTVNEARSHDQIPFETLLDILRPPRKLAQHPLFQIAFNRQPPSVANQWSASHFKVTTGASKFDLTVDLENHDNELLCHFEYRVSLFEEPTMARFAYRYESLLKAISQSAGERVGLLWSRAIRGESTPVVVARPPIAYNHHTMQHMLELWANKTPSAYAIISKDKSFTYKQLNSKANGLATKLKNSGVAADMPIAVLLDKSPELVIAMMGVLKSGAAYFPLDPNYPDERLAFMLHNAKARILITDPRMVHRLSSPTMEIITLDANDLEEQETFAPPPSQISHPKSTAYIIYTSGSTGKPKGTAITQGGLSHLIANQIEIFRLQRSDRVLLFASPSFDASVWEMALAIGAGAALVTEQRESILPGAPLISMMRNHEVTVATLAPSLLANLPAGSEDSLPQLRILISAGEACTLPIVKQWAKNRRFFNAYGPTEITVCATIAECSPDDSQITIGKPLANTYCAIIDRNGNTLPPGIPGELCIGGAGVARGYLNRPDLTAERFIPSIYGRTPGETMYRTGDNARTLPNGNIVFLGRQDNQIKLRGIRIELQEIETALREHPSVLNAAVLKMGESVEEQHLHAFIILRNMPGDKITSPQSLQTWLRQKLPEAMIPSVFQAIEHFPLTINGKIDTAALSALTSSQRTGTRAPESLTDVELRLAAIWKQLLRIEDVPKRDNFFSMGGNSLLLIRMQVAIKNEFNKDISIVDLFRLSTIHALGEYISSAEPPAKATFDAYDRAQKQREGIRRQTQRLQSKRSK